MIRPTVDRKGHAKPEKAWKPKTTPRHHTLFSSVSFTIQHPPQSLTRTTTTQPFFIGFVYNNATPQHHNLFCIGFVRDTTPTTTTHQTNHNTTTTTTQPLFISFVHSNTTPQHYNLFSSVSSDTIQFRFHTIGVWLGIRQAAEKQLWKPLDPTKLRPHLSPRFSPHPSPPIHLPLKGPHQRNTPLGMSVPPTQEVQKVTQSNDLVAEGRYLGGAPGTSGGEPGARILITGSVALDHYHRILITGSLAPDPDHRIWITGCSP